MKVHSKLTASVKRKKIYSENKHDYANLQLRKLMKKLTVNSHLITINFTSFIYPHNTSVFSTTINKDDCIYSNWRNWYVLNGPHCLLKK
jgi:hypothetical protein